MAPSGKSKNAGKSKDKCPPASKDTALKEAASKSTGANGGFLGLSKPKNPNCSPVNKSGTQFSDVRIAEVAGPDTCFGYGLYFDREKSPNGKPYSSWPDKLFCDALKRRLAWLDLLNMKSDTFELHQDGEPVLNVRDWGVRVYVFFAGDILTHSQLHDVALYVMKNVNENADLKDNQKVLVDPDSFLLDGERSWCDLLGNEGALRLARMLHHQDLLQLGSYFEGNPKALLTYWRKGQISPHVARKLCLPTSMAESIGLTPDLFEPSDGAAE